MIFTAEELRRLWLALYRDEIARLARASERHFQPPQVGFSRADL